MGLRWVRYSPGDYVPDLEGSFIPQKSNRLHTVDDRNPT